jgi:hypothetical protein
MLTEEAQMGMRQQIMNAPTFRELVLSEFPSLIKDFEEWEGLLHLQVSEFRQFTQNAIEAHSFGVVSSCFQIATTALRDGDEELRNAIYVSYLEDLDFRSDVAKQAKQLMPNQLKKGLDDILDYNEQLCKKQPRDDR